MYVLKYFLFGRKHGHILAPWIPNKMPNTLVSIALLGAERALAPSGRAPAYIYILLVHLCSSFVLIYLVQIHQYR